MTLANLIGRLVPEKIPSSEIFAKETPASKRIEVSHFNTPNIFETKNGEMGATVKVEGIPFEVQDEANLNYWQNSFGRFIQSLGDEFAFYVTNYRHQQPISLKGEYPKGFADDFNQAYQAKFADKELFVNDIYVTVMLRAGSTPLKKGLAFLNQIVHKNLMEEWELWRNKQVKRMQQAISSLLAALTDYSPQLLGIRETDNGAAYSEVAEYLGALVNADSYPMAYPYDSIAAYIPQKRLFFGNDTIHFQGAHAYEDKYGAIISIKEYAPSTSPISLNGLLRLPIEMIVTHSFLGIERNTAQELIRRQEVRLKGVDDKSISQIEELKQAADDLASGKISFGYHHHTVLVLSKNLQDLEDKLEKVIKRYRDTGVMVIRETLNLENAFWAQIPGNFKRIKRSSLITSNNFSCFCSLHNYYSGYINQNHLGDALMMAETRSKTVLYLNLHEKGSGRKNDLTKGHTLVVGATGSGKTLLMMTFNTMMQKYGQRSFIFDRNYGCEIYVHAMGGSYFKLDPSEKTGWNPCQLEDTPENRAFLRDFIRELVRRPDVVLTARDENQIADVVDRNYTLPFEIRNLSTIASFFTQEFSGLDALSKWLRLPDITGRSGAYAYLFDNDSDTFNSNKSTMGFDMTYLMGGDSNKNKDVLTPVSMYLFHRIHMVLDGTLTGIYLDEGWQFLSQPYWVSRLEEELVTLRKRNGFILFATQQPEKIVQSQLASALIQGSATHIFLPNPKAVKKVYTEGFKLSQKEYEIIRDTAPESRFFLLKQGHDAAVAKIDLSGLSKFISVLSGNTETIALCESLRREHGDNPALWLPHFYKGRAK